MNWFYVDNGQQRGPVTEEDLAMLAGRGAITPETLVWREGLENWRPYREIKPVTAAPPTIAAPGQAVCCECHRAFPLDEVIKHGEVYVCGGCKPIFLQKLREGVAPTPVLNYAGFWIRVGAKVLDSIILWVPGQIINMVFLGVSPVTPGNPGAVGVRFAVSSVIGLVIGCTYSTLMVGKYGATVGKMAAKIKIVNADGTPVSYGKAAGRYFAEILSSMICGIGYLMVAFDNEEKRALHDRICNTRVVRKP
jgi:uncharacterized RDD family membrane protein YckC